MSEDESFIDMSGQYDECQKLPQRIEALNIQFESYQDYCDYLTDDALTVQRIISSDEDIISSDLYPQEDDESDFYSDSDSDSNPSGETDDESD